MDSSGSVLPLLVARDVSAVVGAGSAQEIPAELDEAPFLIFRLGASLFGVPALAVREIHALPALSPLAQTAPCVVGVLPLRGALVPVMDLNARLGQDAAPYQLGDNLVVLNFEGADVALIVGEVRCVEHLFAAQIEAAPAPGRSHGGEATLSAGVIQIGEGIVMLLHLPHLLDLNAANVGSETVRRFEAQVWTPAERAVLAERAARLQVVAQDDSQNAGRAPVALLSLGGEEMGVELSAVREFVSVLSVAPVPCCPPHILGQINLRGDIVTLLDVRAALRTSRLAPPFFEGDSAQNAVSVVVVEHEGAPVGIAVDQVRDVLYLRDEERVILNSNSSSNRQSGRYFSGGALHDGRLLPLLDVARLFAEGDLEVNDGS